MPGEQEGAGGTHSVDLDKLDRAIDPPLELVLLMRRASVSALGILDRAVRDEQQARNTATEQGVFMPDLSDDEVAGMLDEERRGTALWYALRNENRVREALRES